MDSQDYSGCGNLPLHCPQNDCNFILILRKQNNIVLSVSRRKGIGLDIDWLINQQLSVEHHFCVDHTNFNCTVVVDVFFVTVLI